MEYTAYTVNVYSIPVHVYYETTFENRRQNGTLKEKRISDTWNQSCWNTLLSQPSRTVISNIMESCHVVTLFTVKQLLIDNTNVAINEFSRST